MLKVYRARLGFIKDEKVIAVVDAVSFEVYDTGIGISKENI